MTSKKKINFPISIFSAEETYALLGDIVSKGEAMIAYFNGYMWHWICGQDSYWEFKWHFGSNDTQKRWLKLWFDFWKKNLNLWMMVIMFHLKTWSQKNDIFWKWNKCIEKPALKKCSLTGESILNINLQNLSPFQVYTETISLEGLLTLKKVDSEKYAKQIGWVFQTTTDQLPTNLVCW